MCRTAQYFQSKRESSQSVCQRNVVCTSSQLVRLCSIAYRARMVLRHFCTRFVTPGTSDRNFSHKSSIVIIHFPSPTVVHYLPTSSTLVEIIIDTEIVGHLKDNLHIEIGKKAPCQLKSSEARVLTAPRAANVSILWNLFSMRVNHTTQLVWYAFTVRES
jgi:hypothetical protein